MKKYIIIAIVVVVLVVAFMAFKKDGFLNKG